MGGVIGDILPMAIAVALSPLPIIVVILILFSLRARSNGTAFVLGWMVALAILGCLSLALVNVGKISTGGAPSTLAYALRLLLGLLFLFMAYFSWKKRPPPGKELQLPLWLSTLDSFSIGKTFGFAAVWGALNPKNLGLTLAAVLAIAQGGIYGARSWIAIAVFVVLASITLAVPVFYYLVAGASAEKTLTGWKNWLLANNTTVMVVLFLIFGAKLVGDGLDGLFG
jgi:hypothetical protein